MGIREEYNEGKKGKFKIRVGSTALLIAGVTKAEAKGRMEEIKKQKGLKTGVFFELPENINIRNMEV